MRALALAGVAGLILACSDGTSPRRGNPGITLTSASELRDTVWASVRLSVVVRDTQGLPVRGAVVRFRTSGYDFRSRRAFIMMMGAGAYGDSVRTDTSDLAGRATMLVTLGTNAGTGTIIVSAEAMHDVIVPYVVLPGSPTAFKAIPADTSVYVGRELLMRSSMVDRFDNPVGAPGGTHSTSSANITILGSATVKGVAFGRALVVARQGTLVDTAHVSVMPSPGTLAAHAGRAYVGDSIGIALMNLDASGYRRIVVETQPREYGSESPPEHEMSPRWNPAGTHVVYHQAMTSVPGVGERRIYVTDLSGQTRRLLPSSPFTSEMQPDWSRDGSWIYFAGYVAADFRFHIWRVRPDGTGLQAVGGVPSGVSETRPSVSPDGVWLAWVGGDPGRVRVRRIDTGEATPLAVEGTSPRWSPQGDLIAYVVSADHSGYSGALRIVRPDGTGDRAVVSDRAYAPVVDWSPDGKYLVAASSSYGGLELIEVATAQWVPMPFAWRLSQPAWRPSPGP